MDGQYQHILLAVDLHPEDDQYTEQRALAMRELTGAKISLVHAVDHINAYGAAFAYPMIADLQNNLLEEARSLLFKRAEQLNIQQEDIYIEIGAPKPTIIDIAEQLQVDLIIVGAHSHHGVNLLLSSTADAIMHETQCDVLVVRLKDD